MIQSFFGDLILWLVIIHQDPIARPFHIVELPISQRPPEGNSDQKNQNYRDWNKQIENFHKESGLFDFL